REGAEAFDSRQCAALATVDSRLPRQGEPPAAQRALDVDRTDLIVADREIDRLTVPCDRLREQAGVPAGDATVGVERAPVFHAARAGDADDRARRGADP